MLSRVTLSVAVLSTAWLLGCGSTVTVIDHEDQSSPVNEPGSSPSEQLPAMDCKMTLVSEHGSSGTLQITDLHASSSGTSDTVRGSASHVGGRWYFEVSIDSMVGGVWWAQNIGVGTAEVLYNTGDSAGLGGFLNVSGEVLSPDPHLDFHGEPYGPGDVVGVAVDLDAGLVFFSRNGAWMNAADPATGLRGLEILVLPGTGSYYPAVGISEGDAVTVNFGATAFAHAPPAGYAPFAAGLEADAHGDCIDAGPDGVPAPPAPMSATCSTGDFSSYGAPQAGGEELHVIGIYEPAGAQVGVHVERQGDIALVLATYAAATFEVTAAPGANITRIVLSSYEPSSVIAPPGIPVESHVFELSGDYLETGYAWPAATGGSDTQGLIGAAESLTGLELTSFGGCYAGSSFTLSD